MSRDEQMAYRRYMDNRVILQDNLITARGEGRLEGQTEEKISIAKRLKQMGVDVSVIAQSTGLTPEDVEKI